MKGSKKKILVIDDSAETREYIRLALEIEGYKVIEAEDGNAGFKRAQSEPFDLIIMDLSMPGMDGFSLAKQIRSSLALKDVPIIVSTGHGKLKDLFRSDEKIIIQDFIEKPFLAEELVDKVKQVFSRVNK